MMLAVTLRPPAAASTAARSTAGPVPGASADLSARGPETSALMALRRWVVLVSASAVVGTAVLASSYELTRISALEERLVLLSLGLLALAWASLLASPRLLWAAPGATAVLVITAVVSPPTSSDWLPLVSASSYTAYYVALLLPLRLAWAAVPVGGALLAWAWSGRPANAISGALELLGGWPSVLQVMLGAAGLVWAWRVLRREALAADAALERVEARTEDAIRRSERSRVWRSAATRVHESVLNTIRYVAAVDSVDRERLLDQLDVDLAPPEQGPARRRLSELRDDLAADPDVRAAVVVTALPDVEAAADTVDVVRGAVLELARNAVRHGSAGRITVSARLRGGRLEVRVTDDGAGLAEPSRPGVGLTTVLASRVEDLGGTWSMGPAPAGGTDVAFAVPLDSDGPAARPGSFDQGRLLLTAPIAAQSVSVVIFLVALMSVAEPDVVLGAVATALAVCVSIAIVLRRRRVAAWTALLLAVAPVSVPFLLLTSQWSCDETSAVAPVVNASGFALVVLLVWSRPLLIGVPTVALWAAGALALTVEFPADCREAVSLATLNSLVGLPSILLVVAVALSAFRRAADRAAGARLEEAAAEERSRAAADLDSALHDAVAQAVDVLRRVADQGAPDGSARQALAVADGRIRAAIQLDPASAGTLALAVRDGVERAAAHGRPVTVRALLTSDDRRPVPPGLHRALTDLLGAPGVPVPTVQAFTDGLADHVSLRVGPAALAAAGLAAGGLVAFGDATVEVDEEAGEDGLLPVLVSRPCRMS